MSVCAGVRVFIVKAEAEGLVVAVRARTGVVGLSEKQWCQARFELLKNRSLIMYSRCTHDTLLHAFKH